jgi:aspartokinase-like uncharacterized kinase
VSIDLVIKIGGGLLSTIDELERVLSAVARLAASRRVLIVAGGGPFADAVREVDRRIGLTAGAAHWMAVLAMDQYAHLVASKLDRGIVVSSPREAAAALEERRVAVLAPSRWLAEVDPLPHSWDVTSDSIAAWVAGQVDARDLVLVKPRGAAGHLVDAYFKRALPPHVTPTIVPAERVPAVFDWLAASANLPVDR